MTNPEAREHLRQLLFEVAEKVYGENVVSYSGDIIALDAVVEFIEAAVHAAVLNLKVEGD